jgi:Zn-dependent peptidase ImmA (M78 family)
MEKVNPKMITLARESKGLTLAEVGKALKFTAQAIWQLENEYNVSEEVLESLSKALKYPQSFFLQQGEGQPLPLSYRKRTSVPAWILAQVDAHVNIFRLNLEKLLETINYPEPEFPVLDVLKLGSPQECAKKLRKLWKIEKGPIENISKVLEENNVMLLSFPFDSERVDGKCIIAGGKYPLIVTNRKLLGDRQRFTLAYHLGYIIMHWKTSPEFTRDLSHEANLFAAEFLMPEKDITNDLKEVSFKELGVFKKKWKASMISLLHRSDDLELTTANQKRYILEQFNNSGIRKREPLELDIQKENYKLVKDLITKYKTKQELNLKKLAGFFDLEQEDFLERYDFN